MALGSPQPGVGGMPPSSRPSYFPSVGVLIFGQHVPAALAAGIAQPATRLASFMVFSRMPCGDVSVAKRLLKRGCRPRDTPPRPPALFQGAPAPLDPPVGGLPPPRLPARDLGGGSPQTGGGGPLAGTHSKSWHLQATVQSESASIYCTYHVFPVAGRRKVWKAVLTLPWV